MKVFIVDDSMMIWIRLVEIVKDIKNLELVGVAGVPESALKRIRELKPDVVVLDIKLYGGSGIDLLKQIKNALPDTVVIMFTNYPYPQYKDKCTKLGADYFFDKSNEFEKVYEVLSERALM